MSWQELKLRLMMRMMGVRDSAVWTANIIQFFITAVVAIVPRRHTKMPSL